MKDYNIRAREAQENTEAILNNRKHFYNYLWRGAEGELNSHTAWLYVEIQNGVRTVKVYWYFRNKNYLIYQVEFAIPVDESMLLAGVQEWLTISGYTLRGPITPQQKANGNIGYRMFIGADFEE